MSKRIAGRKKRRKSRRIGSRPPLPTSYAVTLGPAVLVTAHAKMIRLAKPRPAKRVVRVADSLYDEVP